MCPKLNFSKLGASYNYTKLKLKAHAYFIKKYLCLYKDMECHDTQTAAQ
jgi:hypothetical protein